MTRSKARRFHDEPEVTVVPVSEIPTSREHNHVDRRFWLNLIERLKLLDPDEALCVSWSKTQAYTHANSGCYWAARKMGLRVSVTRSGNQAYVRRIPDHLRPLKTKPT